MSPQLLCKLPSVALIAIVALSATLLSSVAHAELKGPRISHSDPYLNSVILKSGKTHTLIPKRGILYLPERHKNRLGTDSSGSFLSWSKFLAKNYGWLVTHEVSMDTALGETPITAAQLEKFKKLDMVIVATHKKSLVNVAPAKKQKDE